MSQINRWVTNLC